MEILIRLPLIFVMHGIRLRNQPIPILSFTPVHAVISVRVSKWSTVHCYVTGSAKV